MSPALRRLLALGGAVVLVVGALAITGDLGGGGGGSDVGDGELTLLCATELLEACDELVREEGVTVVQQDAGASTAELSTLPDAEIRALGTDGWVTFTPDAQRVREARVRNQLAPLLDEPSDTIARSPLLLAIWRDRAAALRSRCGGDVTWRCVGDVAGRPWADVGGEAAWGNVKPGHADPETSGEGLLVIGQEATQFLDRIDLSRDDYENDAFLEWFTRLERAVRPGTGGSAFEQMLAAGPAAFDVVGTTEAEAGPLLAQASRDRRDALTLLYPAPVATADVVFAPVVDADGADELGDLVTGDAGRAALAGAGFRVDGEPRAPGVPDRPPLPDGPNLPSAGSLEALLQTWREVTG